MKTTKGTLTFALLVGIASAVWIYHALVQPVSASTTATTAPASDEVNLATASNDALRALALAGDYQAQRNLAWEYRKSDPVSGCAWRKVIVLTHPDGWAADGGDQGNHDIDCGKLTADEQSEAERAAAEFIDQINAGKKQL